MLRKVKREGGRKSQQTRQISSIFSANLYLMLMRKRKMRKQSSDKTGRNIYLIRHFSHYAKHCYSFSEVAAGKAGPVVMEDVEVRAGVVGT